MNRFGISAIKTFAFALADVTSNQVQVHVGPCSARTDGRTIFLPEIGIWDECGFRNLCADACHEMAHVWFRSNAFQQSILADCPPEQRELMSQTINVILDIADETRFEKAMPRAAVLFEVSSRAALEKAIECQAMPQRPPLRASPWQLLAAGIWLVRSKPSSVERKLLRGWRTRVAGMREVIHFLKRARDRRCAGDFQPQRTPSQWRHLRQLVDGLYLIVAKHAAITDHSQAKHKEPLSDPQGHWRRVVVTAASDQAQRDAQEGQTETATDWSHGLDNSSEATSETSSETYADIIAAHVLIADLLARRPIRFDQSVYDHVLPPFRQTARRLTSSAIIEVETGLKSGRLSRPSRAFVDGRCFRRTTMESTPSASVAVAIDHSYSMLANLSSFLPVGLALINSISAIPGVEVGTWRFGTKAERLIQAEDLRTCRLMGGTATHLVLAAAREWLNSRPQESRIIVLFTDGEPDDVQAASEQARRLRREQVQLLVGSIGIGRERCARSLPGAIIFNVDPKDAACSLQQAIRRMSLDS
mgnify:CR=1 FL=1